MLAGFAVDVRRFRRELLRCGVHLFSGGRKQRGQWRLGQPLYLEPRHLPAQLPRDGDIAPRVSRARSAS